MSSDGGPKRFEPFQHLTVPNHALYRAIMRAFLDAKGRFQVHLRPEDVRAALEEPAELSAVASALDALAGWGNLRPDADTGRVTSVEDFYRHRFIYQLTREGEAVEEALGAYDDALGRRGALQSVALADIATQLAALLVLAGEESGGRGGEGPDPGKVHLALITLVHRFNGLADNARAFMGSLQRTIDRHHGPGPGSARAARRRHGGVGACLRPVGRTGAYQARLRRLGGQGDRLGAGQAGVRKCRRRRPGAA